MTPLAPVMAMMILKQRDDARKRERLQAMNQALAIRLTLVGRVAPRAPGWGSSQPDPR